MSLFMALAVRGVSQDQIREKITLPFRTADASAMPLGQAAVGRWKNSGCVLVEVGFGSANLVVECSRKSGPAFRLGSPFRNEEEPEIEEIEIHGGSDREDPRGSGQAG